MQTFHIAYDAVSYAAHESQIVAHGCFFVVQAVRSKYRAAFEAGLQALCGPGSTDGRPLLLLPHIYGSAEYLGDSSAGLGPPDKPAAGACAYV